VAVRVGFGAGALELFVEGLTVSEVGEAVGRRVAAQIDDLG